MLTVLQERREFLTELQARDDRHVLCPDVL
jgi:hypothetical protein